MKGCKTEADFKEFFKALKPRGLEAALSGEWTDHLGYARHARTLNQKSNARHGDSEKSIPVNEGELTLKVSRDRAGTFEPQLIPKHQTHFDGIDEKIISLYARGLSTRDIQQELEALYDTAIAASLIFSVTDGECSPNCVSELQPDM